MELKLVAKTSRSIVVELTQSGKYYADKEYDIKVNDRTVRTDKVVTSIFGLLPDT